MFHRKPCLHLFGINVWQKDVASPVAEVVWQNSLKHFYPHSLLTIRCCFMSSPHKSINVILSDNFVHNTIYGLKHVSWTPALISLAQPQNILTEVFKVRWKKAKFEWCWHGGVVGASCGNWCCDAGVGGDPDLLQGSCHETLMSPDPPATNNIIHCN